MITAAKASGVSADVALMDAGYGNSAELRDGLDDIEQVYCVGIQPGTTVWVPAGTRLLAKGTKRKARPGASVRAGVSGQPERLSVEQVAMRLPHTAWRTVTWRQGTNAPLRSQFAALRVRVAHKERRRGEPRKEEWLLMEWPTGEPAPVHYWLSSLPPTTSLRAMAGTAMTRWRIERDDQELKQEFGLSHYEGRGWRGFHHHATICIAAYGFLLRERLRLRFPTEVGRGFRFEAGRVFRLKPDGVPTEVGQRSD
jgi:SRSO17 transposase